MISPLLFNFCTRPLGKVIWRLGWWHAALISPHPQQQKLCETLEHCLAMMLERCTTTVDRLKLNPDKMEILLLEGNPDQLGGCLPGLNGVLLPWRIRFAIWVCSWTRPSQWRIRSWPWPWLPFSILGRLHTFAPSQWEVPNNTGSYAGNLKDRLLLYEAALKGDTRPFYFSLLHHILPLEHAMISVPILHYREPKIKYCILQNSADFHG